MKNMSFIALFLSVIFFSCSEDDTGTNNNINNDLLSLDYFIYYPISQNMGWRPEHSGLFKFEFMSDNEVDRVETNSMVYCSRIAQNGNLVYLTDDNEPTIWIRYPDGNKQKIILPESYQTDWEYNLFIYPRPEINAAGDKLVYFVDFQNADEINPDDNISKMIIVNLTDLSTKIVDLKPFYLDEFVDFQVNYGIPVGENMIIDDNSDKIYFVMKLSNFSDNKFKTVGYVLIKYENEQLQKVSDILSNKINLLGYDTKNKKIFIKNSGMIFSSSNDRNFVPTGFKTESLYNFKQFTEDGKVVLWNNDGAGLYKVSNNSLINQVFNWDDLKLKYSDIENKPTTYLSISPDGGLITFALHPKNDNQSYHLFAVRYDGSEVKQVVPFTPISHPSVSYGFVK